MFIYRTFVVICYALHTLVGSSENKAACLICPYIFRKIAGLEEVHPRHPLRDAYCLTSTSILLTMPLESSCLWSEHFFRGAANVAEPSI